jgi:hypothetical protein
MIRVLVFIVWSAFPLLANGQEKPKNTKDASPTEVVKQWNEAAAKKDMKVLKKLASGRVPDQHLKLIELQFFIHYQGETKIIHEEISGDRAIVICRLEHKNPIRAAVSYRMTVLVRERRAWKVTQEEGSVALKLAK